MQKRTTWRRRREPGRRLIGRGIAPFLGVLLLANCAGSPRVLVPNCPVLGTDGIDEIERFLHDSPAFESWLARQTIYCEAIREANENGD